MKFNLKLYNFIVKLFEEVEMFIYAIKILILFVLTTLASVFAHQTTYKENINRSNHSTPLGTPMLLNACYYNKLDNERWIFTLESLYGDPDHFILSVYTIPTFPMLSDFSTKENLSNNSSNIFLKEIFLSVRNYQPIKEYVLTKNNDSPIGSPLIYEGQLVELMIQGTGTPTSDGSLPGSYVEKNIQGKWISEKKISCF